MPERERPTGWEVVGGWLVVLLLWILLPTLLLVTVGLGLLYALIRFIKLAWVG